MNPQRPGAPSASARLVALTLPSVMPGVFHNLALSPRSPNDRQTTVTRHPIAASSAIAPPQRHTKSAAWTERTRAVHGMVMRRCFRIWCLDDGPISTPPRIRKPPVPIGFGYGWLGVEGPVLASLLASDPGIDWAGRGAYNLARMLVHGTRRAAEMAEVAATLHELGLPDHMAQATIPWQSALADLHLHPGPADLAARADLILGALR